MLYQVIRKHYARIIMESMKMSVVELRKHVLTVLIVTTVQ